MWALLLCIKLIYHVFFPKNLKREDTESIFIELSLVLTEKFSQLSLCFSHSTTEVHIQYVLTEL